jgi:hypothetical protein
MTGEEDAFVAGFISAHPVKKHPIISAATVHFVIFTCFLLAFVGSRLSIEL